MGERTDLRPAAGSPALGAGVAAGWAFDFDGVPIPRAGRVDIGPFQRPRPPLAQAVRTTAAGAQPPGSGCSTALPYTCAVWRGRLTYPGCASNVPVDVWWPVNARSQYKRVLEYLSRYGIR